MAIKLLKCAAMSWKKRVWVVGLALLVKCGWADQVIYTDSLQNGWQNWSWAAVTEVTGTVHSGTRAFGVTAGAWEAIYLHHEAQDGANFTNLVFWIHGGNSGGQQLQVQATLSGAPQAAVQVPALAANTWREVRISLEALGVSRAADFDGFWIQSRVNAAQPIFYVDDIALISGAVVPPPTNNVATIAVDAAKNRRAISELIYGVAFASSNQLKELNVPLNRSGGNATTRYNWQLNADNRAFDWYFESLPYASAQPGAELDDFIGATRNGGAEPMVTIPLIGWVAKLGPNRGRLSSFSIQKYGPQTGNDSQWFPDAGNGISAANNLPITVNDPNDASVLVDSSFQQGWVRHLTNKWGTGNGSGVRYYFMDNEATIWHSTHRDVRKTGVRMQEYRDLFLDYAAKVKAVDPAATVLAPEEWGWSGYFWSGYDQQWGSQNGWNNLPDRAANGGWDYLPWFLDQARKQEQLTGKRLLDVFTVHYYPQGGEYSSDTSSAMQTRRNRSTRSLWDPNYTDQSWISDKVRLIPRLKQWVSQYYPGTKVGLTEYSWGADNHINGATAQADVLGILGREGIDLANRWVVPASGSPAYNAIKMFRNYDGQKSKFGDTSVSVDVANPDNLASFAAERNSDGALTVIAINKVTATTPLQLTVTNFNGRGVVERWQLTLANQIQQLSNTTLTANSLSHTLPAQSITLFIIPAAIELRLDVIQPEGGELGLKVHGSAGLQYVLEGSEDFGSWQALSTNIFSGATAEHTIPLLGNQRFYRVREHSP